MSRPFRINWGMITAAIMLVGVFGYLGSCARNAFAMVDAPEKLTKDEEEHREFEIFCKTNFEHINWEFKHLNDKLDDLNNQQVEVPLPTQPAKKN